MTLRDMMARHARTVLTSRSHLGELVGYLARGATVAREIRCGVQRLEVEPSGPAAREIGRLRAILDIPRDADIGCETVSAGDRFVVAMRLGGTATSCRLRRIISQDEGMFVVEVEE